MPIRVVIVDDEWLVREELKTLLKQYPQIEVAGEGANVTQAIALLEKYKPDVLFLDVQMPGANGFELFERTNVLAQVIFVTAFDRYAIKAFEVNALDYLLKPIQKERLEKAIQKLQSPQKSRQGKGEKLEYSDAAFVMVDGSLKYLQISSLKCITADGNYSCIYYKEKEKHLVDKTLQEWEAILPADHFVRIHRSAIVNFQYVLQVKKCPNYTHLVTIKDIEKPLVMSRRYAARLGKMLSI